MFVGFLAAMAVASQMHQFHEMFQSNSEPFGLILGAGVMFVVGGARRPHRRVAAGQGRGSGASPRACSRFYGVVDVLLPDAVQPLPHRHRGARLAARAARHRAVGRVDDERGQPHRRARRTGGRHRRDRAAARSSCSPTGCSSRTTSTARTSVRSSRSSRWACASASCRSTGIRRRSSWATRARSSSACLLAVPTITIGGRTDSRVLGQHVLLLRPAAHPGADPRRADPRHGLLVPPAHRVSASSWHQADAGHLHHRLMRLGHGPRRTVVILWAWTALLSGVALRARLHRQRATRSCRSSPRCWRSCCSPGSTPVSGRPRGHGAHAPSHVGGRAGGAVGRRNRGPADVVDLAIPPPQTRLTSTPDARRYLAGNRCADRLRFDSLPGRCIDCEYIHKQCLGRRAHDAPVGGGPAKMSLGGAWSGGASRPAGDMATGSRTPSRTRSSSWRRRCSSRSSGSGSTAGSAPARCSRSCSALFGVVGHRVRDATTSTRRSMARDEEGKPWTRHRSPAVERDIALDIVKRGLLIAPAIILVAGLLRGWDGAAERRRSASASSSSTSSRAAIMSYAAKISNGDRRRGRARRLCASASP